MLNSFGTTKQGVSDVPLTVFGGVAPELSDVDLPEGASAGNQDVDFAPGTVYTRDGIVSVMSYGTLTVSSSAGLGTSVAAAGEPAWLNPNNIVTNEPGTYATSSVQGTFSQYLQATNFRLNVPSAADVVGLVAQINGKFLGFGAPSIVQSNLEQIASTGTWQLRGNYATNSENSDNTAYNGDTVLGSLLIVFVSQFAGGASNPVTDTIGNTYTQAAGNFGVTGFAVDYGQIYYAVNKGSGPNTCYSVGLEGEFYGLTVMEFTGNLDNGGTVLDFAQTSSGTSTTMSFPITTAGPGELVIGAYYPTAPASASPPWLTNGTLLAYGGVIYSPESAQGTYTPTATQNLTGGGGYGMLVAAFKPSVSTTFSIALNNPVTLGNKIVACLYLGTDTTISSVSDSQSNTYTQYVNNSTEAGQVVVWTATASATGSLTFTVNIAEAISTNPYVALVEVAGVGSLEASASASSPVSSTAWVSDTFTTTENNTLVLAFGAATPAASPTLSEADNWAIQQKIAGAALVYQVQDSPTTGTAQVTANSASTYRFAPIGLKAGGGIGAPPADAQLQVTLIDLVNGQPVYTGQLEQSDSSFTVGAANDTWGLGANMTAAFLNSAAFGLNVQGYVPSGQPCVFSVSGVQVTAYLTPHPPQNINYIKTFAQQSGDALTLVLDAAGIFWQEDLLNTPYVLNSFYTEIEPGTYAKSVTYEEHEYIALSNLVEGTDMPRQYNGTNVDRFTQVGPGAAPTIGQTSTGYPIVNITQPAQVGGSGETFRAMMWSAGPGQTHTAGNVITIYYGTPGANAPASAADPNLIVGNCVWLQNFPTVNGSDPNGTYLITSIQTTRGAEGVYNTFCVQAPSTQVYDQRPPNSAFYQCTVATLTTANPAPNIQVGSSITVTGNSVPSWNSTWTVTATPNAAQLSITQTSLTGNVATYDYTLISGTAPTVGQQVTVTGCTNGPTVGGLSIFDVANAQISAVGPNTFSIAINAANVLPAAEEGSAIVNGTIFQFEPGLAYVDTANDPIFGTGTGGQIVQAGLLGAGLRNCVCFFITRNGFYTPPSPYVQFNLNEGASALNVSNIPLGPDEVVGRGLAFTAANGSLYYYIPTPVTVINEDQPTVYSATIINDNVSTSVTLNFTDTLLTSSTPINIDGNNLFNLIELGSCIGVTTYSDRVFAWGEENKVQNLLNMSFDGGYIPNPAGDNVPLGWTVDPTNGGGASLIDSPLYGDAYYIQNTTGSTQALYGMLTQSAYQDQYLVNIIQPTFTYGARVTASCPSQIGSGTFNVDLYSPSFNVVYGKFTVQLSAMTTGMKIFKGNLLTTAFAISAPNDLRLRIYAAALPNGGDVLIDRVELYPLAQPVLQNQFRASYEENPESFDGVTGNFGPNQDNKPIGGGLEIFDNLYCLKMGGGTYVTSDNGITEPGGAPGWAWKTVSNTIGTMGINAWDYGENWFITADRNGLYGYGGGPLSPLSQEIRPVWQLITNYPATVVRNDLFNRRLLIACCIPTPNVFMPEFPVNASPTIPNVMLCLSWKELDSIEALVNGKPVHETYTGVIRAFDFVRKWSYWNITTPYMDFCERPDGTKQLLIGNAAGNSKIYEFDQSGLYSDDGNAINSWYKTYGFVRPETQQATGLGLAEMQLVYGTFMVTGNGTLQVADYPYTSVATSDTQYYAPLTLAAVAQLGETEMPFNDYATRFFLRVGTNAVGEYFNLSKIVVTVQANPWFPVKGI